MSLNARDTEIQNLASDISRDAQWLHDLGIANIGRVGDTVRGIRDKADEIMLKVRNMSRAHPVLSEAARQQCEANAPGGKPSRKRKQRKAQANKRMAR